MILQCDTASACADVPAFIVYQPAPGTITVDGLPLAISPRVEQITIQVAEAEAAQPIPEPGAGLFVAALILLVAVRKVAR